MKLKSLFGKLGMALVAMTCAMGFQSCLDDDDNNYYYLTYPNALVTVKTATDNTFFLQLDDSTTLLPVNITSSPFGEKQVRALVNYDKVDEPSGLYDETIHINWIDSILTKPMAADLGEQNDEVYGTDPVEVVNDWVTIAEDGYLTLCFRTVWGNPNQAHYVNLLPGNNPDDPYEVVFRHNAYGDVYGHYGDGLVAFDLSSLPDTEGKTVKLTLKWQSFSGEKSVQFDYCTHKASSAGGDSAPDVRSTLFMK